MVFDVWDMDWRNTYCKFIILSWILSQATNGHIPTSKSIKKDNFRKHFVLKPQEL